MSRRRKVRLSRNEFTPLLTETLPFEVPVSFSNVGLYEFLSSEKARLLPTKLDLGPRSTAKQLLATILFGPHENVSGTRVRGVAHDQIKLPMGKSVPLSFRVRHDRHGSRTLSIPHPGAQISIAHFYARSSDAVLQYLRKPSFSVRNPTRRASVVAVRDSIFQSRRDRLRHGVEAAGREYEYLTSYYSYSGHRFMFRLFESRRFRELQRQFGWIRVVDIQRCFESIYTHSLSWAYNGREPVKVDHRKFEDSLGDRFDRLMQSMNDLETRGILIGPEFSRIAAEFILQSVDRAVERRAAELGLQRGLDYEILRYVDDYFIFAESEAVTERLEVAVQIELEQFRLYLNKDKTLVRATPYVDPLPTAKARASHAVDENLFILRDGSRGLGGTGSARFQAHTKKMQMQVLAAIGDAPDLYGPVCAYAMTLVESRTSDLLRSIVSLSDRDPGFSVDRDSLIRGFQDLIEFHFWLYDNAPRVSTAVKIVRTISEMRTFLSEHGFSEHARHDLDDLVAVEAARTVSRNALSRDNSVEALFFVGLLADVGVANVRLSDLMRSLGIDSISNPRVPEWFNPLIVFELIRFCDVAPGLGPLRMELIQFAIAHVERTAMDQTPRADSAYYALGVISLPSATIADKLRVARAFDSTVREKTVNELEAHGRWFIEWGPIDLYESLLRKRTHDIY